MNSKLFLIWMLLSFLAAPALSAEPSLKARILIHKKSHWQAVRFRETEEFNQEKLQALALKREALIAQLTRLMREARSEGTRTELGIRLGRLYREKFYLELQRSYQKFQREVAEAKDSKAASKGQPDNVAAQTALDHAIDVFGDLAHGNKKNARRDQVLYYYATSNLERGNADRAMDAYQELTTKFPKSPYATEALVELGDHAFDKNQFAKAEGYYDQLIAKKYEPLITYATYKKAWCAYDTDRKEITLRLFKWVIQNEEHLAGTRMKIRNEALRDIALPFVELRRYNEALSFYQAFPEPDYRRGLETMAQLYSEQGDHQLAINLWENLLSLDSSYAKAPDYDLKIVASLDLKNDRRAAVRRLTTKVALYQPDTEWARATSAAKKDAQGSVSSATKAFEEAMRKYALSYHATAQKLNNEEYYDLARTLYTKYLELYSKNEHAGQMHFNLAEIHAKNKRYLDAATQYYEAYKALADGSLREDALRRGLSSLDQQLNLDHKSKGLAAVSVRSSAPIADDGEESPKVSGYSDTETRFLAVADEYLKKYPKVKDAPDVIYEQAYLEYQHHDFEKARVGFAEILAHYASHETAYSAARLTLDIMGRADDSAKLITACKSLLTNPGLSQPGFREEVAGILRRTELKRIQAMEDDKQFKEAGDAYVEYIKGYGYQDEGLFEKALYNAAVDYGRAGAFESQVESLERFLRRFPKSKLAQGVLLQTAKAYEGVASFEKAAPLFEKYASLYPKDAQAKNALRLAGVYYWGSGETASAEKALKGFIEKYPKDATPVEEDLMNVYASAGSTAKAVRYQTAARNDIEEDKHPVESLVRLMRIIDLKAQKSGKISSKLMQEALDLAEDHKRAVLKSATGPELYSRLLFWQAEKDERAFYSLKLSRPQPGIEADLKKKLDLMKELEASYATIAALGSPRWGIGSIEKTAAAYRQLALDVQRAPIPADLSGKALDAYRDELKKTMIDPFNEKALTFAQRCLDKADDLKALTAWTARCYQILSALDAKRFPKVHTFYLPPLQTALLVPTLEEKKLAAGNSPTFAFPFLSSGLFGMNAVPERALTTSQVIENLPLADSVDTVSDDSGAMPLPTSYRALTEKRKEALAKGLEAVAPKDKEAPSFAYLNLLRLLKPEQAITAIHRALMSDSKSPALHNLLGLAYLEVHNLSAAKVTWLSMVARNEAGPAVWNNLGVVMVLEGNEEAALSAFNKAAENDAAKEALVNLGFLALKYRNGAEAGRDFDRVLATQPDTTAAQVGSWEAAVQQGRFEEARDALAKLSQDHSEDPYARLASSYFLMEVENQAGAAQQLLSSYIESEALQNDVQFRRALNQARQLSSTGGELPAVDASGTPQDNSSTTETEED